MASTSRNPEEDQDWFIVGGCNGLYLLPACGLKEYQQAHGYAVMFGLCMLIAELIVGAVMGVQLGLTR